MKYLRRIQRDALIDFEFSVDLANFLNDLSNSAPAVRRYSEGRKLARLKTITGEDMTQYLVAIHHPDDYDPYLEVTRMRPLPPA
jgi:hypothetical protein